MIGLLAATAIKVPSIDWFAIAPEIALFAAALVIVLGRSLIRHDPRVHEASLLTAIVGVLGAGVFTFVQWTFVQKQRPVLVTLLHQRGTIRSECSRSTASRCAR